MAHGGCSNCGHLIWIRDNARGDRCCASCGAIQDQIFVAAPRYNEVFDDDGNLNIHGAKRESYVAGDRREESAFAPSSRSSSSAPYKRATYFSERLSQWQMLEPEINERDWELIASTWRFSDFWKRNVLTKEDIRAILRRIDECFVKGRPRFVKKYLEKHLTIRYRLCGVPSHGSQAPAWVIEEMRHMFDCVQIPFDRLVRCMGQRYSFPSYNFIFRRFCDLLGCKHYAVDFPPLKSAKKRDEIARIWLILIKYLRWPYINSDGATFGSEYSVDIKRISRETPQQQQQRRRTHDKVGDATRGAAHEYGEGESPEGPSRSGATSQAHAYNCAGGLRGQRADGASTSCAMLSDDPWLHDVFTALDNLDGGFSGWSGDDNQNGRDATDMDISCDA